MLAVFVGLAMLTVSIGAIGHLGEVISPTEGELLGTVLGAAIGALGAWLGVRHSDGGDRDGE